MSDAAASPPAAPAPLAPAPVSLAAPSAWTRATRSGGLLLGVVLVAAMILIAAFAAKVAPYDPDDQDVILNLVGPSAEHWFGTDAFGRDVLSRVIWGARISLFVGFVATLAGVVIGTVIGVVSGYYGGAIDKAITAATDVLLSFPQLIMGLMLVAVLGPNLRNLILAIAVTAIPAFIRVARGSTLAMKERDFVDACRALGYGDLRIMFLHVLPNIMDEVVVMASLWLATAIRTESTLAFIGLGVPPPTATWGGIVREGFDNLLDAWWLSVFPSLAILLVMIALNLIGDGLRDATDPRAPQ
ncbi:ABC transporter permease [Alsobacter sp. KACC 23698]|uniref:ABC transporter permease n=1 Tax=Alsobacter sp. KACC 23698 TaxID=3149229 RepID=A0AAU7JA42_9HYPH